MDLTKPFGCAQNVCLGHRDVQLHLPDEGRSPFFVGKRAEGLFLRSRDGQGYCSPCRLLLLNLHLRPVDLDPYFIFGPSRVTGFHGCDTPDTPLQEHSKRFGR